MSVDMNRERSRKRDDMERRNMEIGRKKRVAAAKK
eukprot:CAMPEP_0184491462 /NCGR_PEP_ID=MMETSP0113_2-20130426/20470_1 /TAXON_ID=91329 /ORGANISM="Norrisiella sphaerica, Strain BC52" /LENGTH=34 /DNA_ID= /DNA_START= /DNA_END= /DNA_ORIENTATION=